MEIQKDQKTERQKIERQKERHTYSETDKKR